MKLRKLAVLSTLLAATLLGLALPGDSAPVAAGSAPRNLRVTGVTDWTAGLQWDRPTGSAPASIVLQCSNGSTMTVPGTQTSATFSNGFDYNRTYTFRAYAVASNGSWSNASNSVTTTLLTDTTPPTKPIVSANAVGPTHVNLDWSCFDACPIMRFDIYMNGQLLYGQVAGTSKRIVFLHPSSGYTFTIRARDAGGNWSQMSDAFTVKTPAADPTDKKAPTTPPEFWGGVVDGANEAMFFWNDSTDNVTSPDLIQYHLYVNGVFDGGTIDPYPHRFSSYLTMGIINTIELYAVDEAGNRSVPATMTIDLR